MAAPRGDNRYPTASEFNARRARHSGRIWVFVPAPHRVARRLAPHAPYRASDHLTTAVTQYNDQRKPVKLDGDWSYIDATRIERTPTGSLLIRPKTDGVARAYIGIGKALVTCLGSEFPDKVYPGWCVLPASDGEEFWEFEW